MKKKSNHIASVENKYIRRKNRINTIAKQNSFLPRMIINKSNKYNYVMVIDSANGNVLLNINDKNIPWNKTIKATELWKIAAKELLSKNIDSVVFDRNWYIYHGRVKSIADSARDWWLKI